MPRSSVYAICKVCGARAVVKKYSSKGSNAKQYYYERYTHRNGVVHYFRTGKRVPRTDLNEAFEQMIETKMKSRSYRYKDIKAMFESVYGPSVSNTTISRSLEKAVKKNLLEKKIEKNVTYYKRVELSEMARDMKIDEASLTLLVSGNRSFITLFLYLKNHTEKSLKAIPIILPSGSSIMIEDLNLTASDQDGRIECDHLNTAYVYPGQIGFSLRFNRSIRPTGKNLVLLQGNFDIKEDSIKFSLPLNTEFLRIGFNSPLIKEVYIRKRLLDGFKETNPESIKRGTLEGGNSYTEVEFYHSLKGETIVVSW